MDMLKQLNSAVRLIEDNLRGEIDFDKAAGLACVSKDSFMRFFVYMTGMTLNEYIRRRRLTLAAFDLRNSDFRVIDVAVLYGWDSADAFSKAFKRQHGVTPAQARDPYEALNIYPPVSFSILIKGATKMDFKIIEPADIEVYGVSDQFEGKGYKTREELRHIMWSEQCDDVPGRISNHSYDGVWFGIWKDGKYMIARKKSDTENGGLEKSTIPAGTYAVFKTGCGGLAWEEFPKLFDLIFDSWLPDSGYRPESSLIVEVLHLWTDKAMRNQKRYYEVWIPVVKKLDF